MGKKIGIDLGTTYSCMAFLNENGALEAIKNSEGSYTTPSIVYFESETNVVVGERARAGALFNPENVIERIKSFMGDKDYSVEMFGQAYSPSAISSLILRKLKEDAEERLGEEIDGVVITCPAYFGTIARGATQTAAENAGLKVYSIINEPTAAAFAYAYIKNEDIDKTVLIYDLGGGTFDCTLMKMNFHGDSKNLRILASNGDHTLGGKDWDKAFTDYVISEFCSETGVDENEMKNDAEMMAWFSENIEIHKKRLSELEKTRLPINFQGNKKMIDVTRDTFDSITESWLSKTISLVDDMLKGENITMDAVDEIILVGGSTRMPQVEKILKSKYGKPVASYDQDEAVAKGAALMAAFSYAYSEDGADGESASDAAHVEPVKSQDDDKGISFVTPKGDIVVDDITNKSYGVKVWDENEKKHFVVNLIKAKTPKPCRGTNTGIMDLVIGGATSITVCESDYTEDVIPYENSVDVYTGPLNVPNGLDPQTPVEVVFDLNLSAVLSIKTVVNGIETNLVFNPTTGGASTEGNEQAKKLSLS